MSVLLGFRKVLDRVFTRRVDRRDIPGVGVRVPEQMGRAELSTTTVQNHGDIHKDPPEPGIDRTHPTA